MKVPVSLSTQVRDEMKGNLEQDDKAESSSDSINLDLRRKLDEATMGLAEMEKEYMNLLTSMANDQKHSSSLIDGPLTQSNISLEKKIDSLEDKIQEMQHTIVERNAEVDRLRKDLTSANIKRMEIEMKFMNHLALSENEKSEFKSELENQVQQEKAKVNKLTVELCKKDDDIALLQQEISQTRENMRKISVSRKEEIEELNEALLDKIATLAEQERCFQQFKAEIDERKLHYDVNFDFLQSQRSGIIMAENESRGLRERNAHLEDQMRMKNLQLEEITILKDKLETKLEKDSSDTTAKVLRNRNEALKKEVEKLTKKLKKLKRSSSRSEM